MEKLSISSLRKIDGVTELYAEAINYAFISGRQAGSSFFGVPGHERYASSKILFRVLSRDGVGLTLGWQDKKTGEPRTISVTFAEHISQRKTDGTSTAKTVTQTAGAENVPTEPVITPVASQPADGGMEALLSAFISQQSSALVEAAKKETAEKYQTVIDELKRENKQLKNTPTGTVINVTVNGKTETTHTYKVLPDCFGRALRRLKNGKNVFFYGPAGSGKNVISEELAKAMGAKFYYFNTLVTKFDLTGYCDAKGNYIPTPLYEAVKNAQNGGESVVMLDEICTGAPEALVCINAALANGYFTFANSPVQVPLTNVHFIAADNTNGQGATDQYNGRYKMDESTRDRFSFIKLDYLPQIEESICGEHKDILTFLRDVRSAAAKLGLSLICGYRAFTTFVEEEDAGEEAENIVDECLLKGMNVDDCKELLAALENKSNKYAAALEKLANK